MWILLYCFHRIYACMKNFFTNLFSPNDYKKNDKMIYKYFKNKYVKSQVYIKKNRWKKKLSYRWNKTWWFNECKIFKKTYKYLNYVEHLLILASTITGCVSISTFASLVCVAVGIKSSAVGVKICPITSGIKKYKSIIKKKKKTDDKIVLLIEILISKFLILVMANLFH